MPLYKFLPADPNIVIANRKLRFTRPSGLNDPFELRPYFDSIATDKQIADMFWEKFDIGKLFDQAYEKLPQATRAQMSKEAFFEVSRNAIYQDRDVIERSIQKTLNSFFGMLPALTKQFRDELFRSFEKIGILSLSEDVASNYMWMHYAAGHKGYAIEFDEHNPFFNSRRTSSDEFYHLRKVEYVEQMPTYSTISDLDGTKLFCIKGQSSAPEREWRMLVPLKQVSDQLDIASELLEFPEMAVMSVTFGMKSESSFRNAVLQHLDANPAYSHVKRRIAIADYQSAKIQFSDL